MAGIALLALALRLVDPLSSPVLAAEDPVIHLYRAERWVTKGVEPVEYPPGLPALLIAARAYGLPLVDLARFWPPLLGAASAVGMAVVARRLAGADTRAGLHAGLAAGLLMACTPEAIRRTTLLAPTAIDLALAPLLLWLVLDLREGRTASLVPLAVVGAWLLVSHPWGMAYLALALLPLVGWTLLRAERRWVAPVGLLAGVLVAMPLLDFLSRDVDAFTTRAAAWLTGPTLAYTPPRFTEPLDMLGVTLMALALLGALRGPGLLRGVGLGWVAALLPLAVLNLTGRDYVPYRTVAFLVPGLVLLGAAGLAWLWPRLVAALPPTKAGVSRAGPGGMATPATSPGPGTLPGTLPLTSSMEPGAPRSTSGSPPLRVARSSAASRAAARDGAVGSAAPSRSSPGAGRTGAAVLAAALVLTAALPAAAMEPWYRVFTPAEQDAIRAAAEVPGAIVLGGTWQSAALATAWGADGRVHPEFFRDWKARAQVADEADDGPLERPMLLIIDAQVRDLADPAGGHARPFDLRFLEGEAFAIAEGDGVLVLRWTPENPWKPPGENEG